MSMTCIIIDDEPHTVAELQEELGKQADVQFLRTFTHIGTAIQFLEGRKVDIVFCDINLPGKNGIELAKILWTFCRFLVYVTAHRRYALDAFGVHATGFLLKPITAEVVVDKLAEIRRLKDQGQENDKQKYIEVKGTHKNDRIKLNVWEITHIEADSNYINIHFVSEEKKLIYMYLRDIYKSLTPFGHFYRISRSIVINLDKLKEIRNKSVLMEDGEEFVIGETYRDAFHAFMQKRTG